MAGTSGIRWPSDLREQIEKAQVEDKQANFTDEVLYLVKLGLEEAEWQRQVVLKAKAARRGNTADPQYEPLKDANFFSGPQALKREEAEERAAKKPGKVSNGDALDEEK